MVSYALKSEGYIVIEAADGEEALAKANANAIDLVLTDQNMPNMDGFTMVRTLRGLPKFAKTPILMLTTEFSEEKKMKGKEAGANGWLVKPFNPHRLLEIIRTFLG